MTPILEVNNLSVSFKTEFGFVKAVDNVSFKVNAGEIIGLVGESGSGKSVSSFSIMRLLPKQNSRIDSGEIMFEGKDLLKMSPSEMTKIRGKEISMIFQEPMTSLNPVYTIGNQIGEVFKNHTDYDKKTINTKSLELLNRVGIPRANEILKSYPHQLSGGMRQRVIIAIAIALKPKILIADEPTTALDVTIQAQILQLIRQLAKEDEMSVIFISHNLGVINQICKNIMVMYSSQIVESADTLSLYKNPLHPYTKCLLKCIPQIGMSGKKLNFIEGTVPHPSERIIGCRFARRCKDVIQVCLEKEPELLEVGNHHLCKCWRENKNVS